MTEHASRTLKYGQGTLVWSEQTSGTLTEQAYTDSLRKNRDYARALGIDYAFRGASA